FLFTNVRLVSIVSSRPPSLLPYTTLFRSLNPSSNLYGASLIPDNWSFVHYEWLFTNPRSNYLLWYRNTLIVAISVTLIGTLITRDRKSTRLNFSHVSLSYAVLCLNKKKL